MIVVTSAHCSGTECGVEGTAKPAAPHLPPTRVSSQSRWAAVPTGGAQTRRGVVPLLDDPAAGLRAYLVILGPGEEGEPGTVHKGVELVLVGNGVVQVVLNEETPVMRGGDALLVTRDAIHGWRNLLPETARLFWIVRD